MAYLYRHIRLDKNEPFYIGISKKDEGNYARAYNFDSRHRNEHWVNIYNKTEVLVEILMEDISYELAKEKEVEFIALYKRISDGGTLANLTIGGDGVTGFRNVKLSERNKIGLWRGKKHTEESKLKIGAKHKGKMVSEESRRKMSMSTKGMYYTGINNPKYRGRVYAYKNGEFVGVFTFPNDAAKELGVSVQYVNKCLCGNGTNYKGLMFKRNVY